MSYREIIAELDALSRTRALTHEESCRLERALRDEARYGGPCPRRPDWDAEEDQVAVRLRRAGYSYGSIAKHIPRSPDAVAARLRYLGCRGAEPRFTLGGVSAV